MEVGSGQPRAHAQQLRPAQFGRGGPTAGGAHRGASTLSTRERLRAVAAAFLSHAPAPPRLLVVGGEANGHLAPGPIEAELRRAAASLGLRVIDVQAADAAQAAPDLLLWNLGALDASSLDRLCPPCGIGPDLLLWTLPLSGEVPLRSRYLLGLWAWALGARRVRCVTTGVRDKPATTRALQEGLQWAGYAGPCEVLEDPGAPQGAGPLCRQILHSVLSAPPRADQARG